MKKLKIMVIALLSIVMVCGTAIPSYAASTDVMIEVRETAMDNVSVTVPTTLPIVFNENGTNTLPTNWNIENTSAIAGIHLSKVEMNAGESGWKLLADSEDTRKLPLDTKAVQFSIGKESNMKTVAPVSGTESASGTVSFDADEIVIASGETQTLAFKVNRGAFSSSQASAKAFDMVLTFKFN